MPPSPPRPATNRHRHRSPSVSVVIPVYDATGLPLVLRGLGPAEEVIVVTGATGGDVDAAVRAACPAAVLVRQTRSGIGNALACGFATGTGDVVIALNGDGSTDPSEIPRYVQALLDGADAVLGSRYRDGGRDLTGGRFRRRLNLLLVWVVNVLFGTSRTDPGFGYAAFWRHTVDQLGLPDPAGRIAVWGDGPEFAALLTVRTAALGLSVTEVGSVAYPRMRRPSRTERPALRHWLRALTTEYAHRRRGARTAARHAGGTRPRTAGGFDARSRRREPAAGIGPRTERNSGGGFDARSGGRPAGGFTGRAPAAPFATGRPGIRRSRPAGAAEPGRTPPARAADDAGPAKEPSTATEGPRLSGAGPHAGNDDTAAGAPGGRRAAGEPIWGPPRRRSTPGRDLWQQAERAGSGTADGPPARGPSTADSEPAREVGARRRRLEAYWQRPDLRVINGEGTGSERTGSGRLRPVPRENLGG
jgi:hypothetical protein